MMDLATKAIEIDNTYKHDISKMNHLECLTVIIATEMLQRYRKKFRKLPVNFDDFQELYQKKERIIYSDFEKYGRYLEMSDNDYEHLQQRYKSVRDNVTTEPPPTTLSDERPTTTLRPEVTDDHCELCTKESCGAIPFVDDIVIIENENLLLEKMVSKKYTNETINGTTRAKRSVEWLEAFDEGWIEMIQTRDHFLNSAINPVIITEDVKKWLRFESTPDDPLPWKYYCPVCQHYLDNSIVKKVKLAKLTMFAERYKNTEAIRNHLKSGTHAESMKQLAQDNNEMLVQHVLDDQDISNSMINMLKLVYIESRANVRGRSHPLFVNLLESTGSNIGNSLYSKDSFTDMLEFLSYQFHNQLILKLKRNVPVSILLDGSDEKYSKNHLMLVSFVTLSLNSPVTYFYRLLDITNDQTALGILKNRKFILFFHAFTDVLEEIRMHLLTFQQAQQVLIDVLGFKQDLQTYLADIIPRRRILTRSESFVKSCTCDGSLCTGFGQFCGARIVSCSDVILDLDNTFSTLSFEDFIKNVVDSLTAQLNQYFPTNDFTIFEIFLPKKLPRRIEECNIYGHDSISLFVRAFNLGQPQIFLLEWQRVLEYIVIQDPTCVSRELTPHLFWTGILNGPDIEQYPNIVRVLKMVLAIPSGTVDVERSFSVMNHIKTRSNSLLSLQHLEDRMRLSINGPDNLESVPFQSFAGKWQATRNTPDKQRINRKSEKTHLFRPLFLDDWSVFIIRE